MGSTNGRGSTVYCGSAPHLNSPPSAPFIVSRTQGLQRPFVFTMQAILEDAGAANPLGLSVTNSVILVVQ